MKFRYDINGLRAIAVLAVVIFHFTPHWLAGGFAGVDVFFVISGFLMTAIIFNSVENNTFNLFKFYTARANRIFPVLAAMFAVLLVFAWFYLLPNDYRNLAIQVEKSALFISNLFFAKGGGYFDTAEHTKWLLHTWSLSVEWQFYLFFPIIIVALKKYLSFTNLKRVVIGLLLASFIYCIYATSTNSKTAYFLLSSRAWEMLLGGLAFLYPWSLKKKLHQITAQCLGLILIVASYFFISKDIPWPGYMAFVPVFGAYLILVSNYQNNILINNPIFSAIGKWSYSIYVWHWPLVVFGFYFAIVDWWIYGIPLSILLGFLSYQFIEKINFTRYSSWKEIYKVKSIYLLFVVFICAFIVEKTDGMKFHYSPKVLEAIAESNNANPYKCDSNSRNRDVEECQIGNKNNIKAIIIGDSHADSLTTAVASAFDLKNEGIISIATASCPFLVNINIEDRLNNDDCHSINLKRLELIESKKYANIPIILISRLTVYLEGQNDAERVRNEGRKSSLYFANNQKVSKDQLYTLTHKSLADTLCRISKTNPTYITYPVPEFSMNIPKTIAKNLFFNRSTPTTMSYEDYLNRSSKLRDIIQKSAQQCGATTIDPAQVLCPANQCISSYQGRPIYRDGDHLSEYGNKLLTPTFKKTLE